jgi:hypothetical protein
VIIYQGGNNITIICRNNLRDKQVYAFKGKVHAKGDRQLYQSGLFKQSNIGNLFGYFIFNLGDEKKLACF